MADGNVMTNDDAVQRAREMIAPADRVVVFSGAGLSAESGIPTFRDEGGIWERYPPEDFATVPGLVRTFLVRPDRVREFVWEAVRDVTQAEPNPAHRAIANWSNAGRWPSSLRTSTGCIEKPAARPSTNCTARCTPCNAHDADENWTSRGPSSATWPIDWSNRCRSWAPGRG